MICSKQKALALALFSLVPLSSNADFVSFSENFDAPTVGISYVGNATQSGPWAQLTQNTFSQRGAIWNTTAFTFNSFVAQFDFIIGPSSGEGADGLTFAVIDAGSYDPNTALGGGGGGLGYLGLDNSFAVEFDTWNNGGTIDGFNANHVGINQNGSIVSLARQNLDPTTLPLETTDGTRWLTATISMDSSGLIDVAIDGTTYLSYSLSGYSNNVYFGFTAATGAAIDGHYVDNWNMRIRVTEPGTLAMLGIGLLGIAATRRRRKV